MRDKPLPILEACRIKAGPLGSDAGFGNNGAFVLSHGDDDILVVVSDGASWDHVSVSICDAERCPTWEEMCYVKDLFFRVDETVVQFHPKKSEYINRHPYTLHLWRHQVFDYTLPISLLI